MFKLWIVVLATLPFQIFIFWALGWYAVDTMRERRIARAAAAEARAVPRRANPPADGERASSWHTATEISASAQPAMAPPGYGR
jgi:hypothetical protein